MGLEQNEGTSFPPSEPKLCVNGGGFFGTPSNMNVCSKCYRNLRAEEEREVDDDDVVSMVSVKPEEPVGRRWSLERRLQGSRRSELR